MTQPMAAGTELPSGTLLDNRYMIERLLGQGGFGRTYLAFNAQRFNEPCVVKEFAPSGTGEHSLEKSRNLFKREAKILHQLEHPQIPKFLACFERQGRLFLVQEYVNGKTYSALLQEHQQQGRSFAEGEVIQWLRSLLPILEYIHERGIIHRDISPDNVMLPQGSDLPVLIDFGVGKQTIVLHHSNSDGTSGSDQTSFVGKMTVVGKVGYAPPEQISLGQCSPSCDIYALGVTAVVLLTGREPTLLMDQNSLEWRWRSYIRTSNAFAQVLDKMIANRPRDRYQTAKEVIAALELLNQPQATTPSSASEASFVVHFNTLFSLMNRSNVLVAVAAASTLWLAVMIALGAGLGTWCTRRGISICGSSKEPTTEVKSYKINDPYPIEVSYSDALWKLNIGDDYPPNALTGTRELIQLVAKNQDSFSYKTNIMFKIEQVDRANQLLGDYFETQTFIIKQLGTFKIESQGQIKLNEENAYEIVYSGYDGEHHLKRRRIIAASKRDSNVPYFHLITYTTAIENYDQHLEAFDDLLQSVVLK